MEDLVLSCLESRVEENRNLYARFLVGPFLKGDALTVATALRRVLLSSIESIGITALYIQGITHEFSTLVGVRESILELSLNFQAIVLSYDKTFFQKKGFFDDLQIGYLQVQGPQVIYANHLKLPLGVKLVDPTQYIATVSKEGSIVLKFIIGKKKAFLHQNTGPESYFGNPAKDLPITGKLSKKNIVRAKKPCIYKKGCTIDWLPMKFLSKNFLQRKAATFAPRLFTEQIRSFTKTHFFYKYPICTQRKTGLSTNLRFDPLRLTSTSTNLRFALLTSTNLRFVRRFVCKVNKSSYKYKYKSTICKKICTCKRSEVRRFILGKRFAQPQQKQMMYIKTQGLHNKKEKPKLCSHKTKGQFALQVFTKQRRPLINARFSYKYPISTCTSSLLKKDLALLIKKDENRKENDIKKKKTLFLKSNDSVFKSNICLRNVIPLDFTLTPVLKVNFVVEIDDEVLYLRQKVRERIIFEVWTNGSIHPRQAVHDAALSLTDIFASFRSIYEAKY